MPKRNPVVSDSEVYEIKKLRWKELSPNSFWTKLPPYDYLLNVYLSEQKPGDACCQESVPPATSQSLEEGETVIRRFLRWLELKLTGHWTYCSDCNRFTPSLYCDCESPRPRHKKKGE